MSPDTPVIYNILISIAAIIIYSFVFYKMNEQNQKLSKRKLALIAVISCLAVMLFACIFTSIGNRLAFDNILTAALKGIIPLFVFAIVFAAPIWIPIAICNFICLSFMKFENRN